MKGRDVTTRPSAQEYTAESCEKPNPLNVQRLPPETQLCGNKWYLLPIASLQHFPHSETPHLVDTLPIIQGTDNRWR